MFGVVYIYKREIPGFLQICILLRYIKLWKITTCKSNFSPLNYAYRIHKLRVTVACIPVSCSQFLIHCSLFLGSLFPVLCAVFPVSCSLFFFYFLFPVPYFMLYVPKSFKVQKNSSICFLYDYVLKILNCSIYK